MSNYDDFLHFRKLFEISKRLKIFPHPGPWGPFSLISHLCTDFIQMSEFLYFSCPDVKLWWFSSFSETFRKIEKIENFPHPGPGDPFRSFHTCAQISSKWVNFYILVVLMSNYDDFLHFRKLFEKSKKLKIFPTPALGTLFAHFTIAHRFHPNEWIFIFQLSWCQIMMIFFIFGNFSKNQKNWRFSPPWGLFSLISHLCTDFIQMSEFLYFSCSDVKLWWFSSFSETFRKIEKTEDFPHPGPWGPFSLISHLCTDFIQMSEFLYFSCPDVKLWWFSSFSETFRKIEKIENFPHPGPGDPFRSFHTCAQISSKWVNFYVLVVLMSNYDDFLHFRKLFEKSKKLKIFPTPALGTLFAHFTLVHRFHPNEWIFIF